MTLSSLQLRLVSGFILGPLTLAAIIFGGLAFQAFVAIAFGLSVKEWMGMARKGGHVWRDGALGLAYMIICYTAFLKLRLEMDQGLFLTFCLMIGIWSSDIGAYFSGKIIGGPKLAEKISPNKTWAGLIGGMVVSALALAALNYYLPFTTLTAALLVGGAFTIVGQIGDLLISGYKRRVGVKDTGNLIPGHGGILDRIDSLMLVTPFFLIVLTEIVP